MLFSRKNLAGSADDDFAFLRRNMVERQIRDRGIRDPRVLNAMNAVPRHAFVPLDRISHAYIDEPLPIGDGQTISQPFMVAAMAAALALEGSECVLEVGAGSGYQAAVLALLARQVITIESRPRLADVARERLNRLGFHNVSVEQGDGSLGWPQSVPYDAILVSAAAPSIPQPLIDQLAESGRIAVPVGDSESQQVVRLVKRAGQTTREALYHCRFVPLVGQYGWPVVALKAPSE